MDEKCLQECGDAALKIASLAGSMILHDFNHPTEAIQVAEKSHSTDFVTESDKRVETYIMGELKRRFPSHRFIGEENVSEGNKAQWTDQPTWIVDPIDGTTNFIHRIPMVCTSIGLWVEKKPVVGVIYNPIQGEVFSAIVGRGIAQSIMVTTVFPSNQMEKVDDDLERIRTLQKHGIRGHRTFGSAALNMAYLACGRVDLYFDYGIHCWDMAAGTVIVTEAGGTVKDTTGEDLNLMSGRMLCASTEELALCVAPLLKQSLCPFDA